MVAAGNHLNSNEVIAELLKEIAALLRSDGASAYRVAAYERSAETLADMSESVEEIFRSCGLDGLIAIPTIGRSIAGLIEHYFQSHHVPLLDRLRGEENVELDIAALPTVGPELARRIHECLRIESLPELLAAANDGRLSKIPGLGEKRIRAIRESLHRRGLDRHRVEHVVQLQLWDDTSVRVSTSELLVVDAQFRSMMLKRPSRSDSARPVLIQHGNRQYNVHYSDSPRAQQLHATADWVVVTLVGQEKHQRWTIITSHTGRLNGCRTIGGREDECYRHYREQAKKAVELQPMVWS